MRQWLRSQHSEPDLFRAFGQLLRSRTDPDDIIRTLLSEAVRLIEPARASVWLTTGGETPRLVGSAGRLDGTSPTQPSGPVSSAIRRRRVVTAYGSIAAPMIAPRTGLLGVLCVDGVDPERAGLIADMATEAGYVFESATLYERAIAERDKSEAILSRVGDAVVVTDAHGAIVNWNRSAEITFGDVEAEVLGRSCAAALRIRGAEGPLDCSSGCALLAMMKDKTGGVEVTRTTASGDTQPLLATVATVTEASGAIYECVHSFRDITRLKQADEAKTLFLATASHELKTPLTVIHGFAQLLSADRHLDDADRAAAVDAIERRSRQLTHIVDKLLISSRIEAGRAEVHMDEVDILPILRHEVGSMGRTTEREIELFSPSALPTVMGDADAIATVVGHLLDNAVKYSPNGAPVTLTADLSDPARVTIRVADRGIGMDAEQAEHCFDKFWQAESTDVRRFGGTGIGLFIVRSLVVAMDGTVSVETKRNVGTTFTVDLRRADAPIHERIEVLDDDIPLEGPEPSIVREFMRQLGIPARSDRIEEMTET